MRPPIGIAAASVTAAIMLGPLAASAVAESAPPAACSQQQAQVERAEAALERVTAVFARQQARVSKAKGDLRSAENASERGQAQRALAAAKSKRADAKKAKKAQLQRLAKAEERLQACESAQQPAVR